MSKQIWVVCETYVDYKCRPLVILGYPKIDHEKDYVYFWMPFSLLTVARALRETSDVDVVLFDGNQRSIQEWETLVKSEAPARCSSV